MSSVRTEALNNENILDVWLVCSSLTQVWWIVFRIVLLCFQPIKWYRQPCFFASGRPSWRDRRRDFLKAPNDLHISLVKQGQEQLACVLRQNESWILTTLFKHSGYNRMISVIMETSFALFSKTAAILSSWIYTNVTSQIPVHDVLGGVPFIFSGHGILTASLVELHRRLAATLVHPLSFFLSAS